MARTSSVAVILPVAVIMGSGHRLAVVLSRTLFQP